MTYIDNRNKAANEVERATIERERISQEIKLKEQEYVGKFVDKAIDDDIELRIRFAEYFAAILGDPRWAAFLKILADHRDDFYKKIDEVVAKLATEQGKEPRDDVQIAAYINQLNRIQKQVGTLKLEYAKVRTRLPAVESETLSSNEPLTRGIWTASDQD